jgi:hypothetical protein
LKSVKKKQFRHLGEVTGTPQRYRYIKPSAALGAASVSAQ